MAKIMANTYVADRGWTCRAIVLDKVEAKKVDVRLETVMRGQPASIKIESVEQSGGKLVVTPAPFAYMSDWTLHVGGKSYTRKDVTDENIEGLDAFEAINENGVVYRIYRPKNTTPRPLILFLHGGGECGTDNVMQMVGTVGAIRLAELYPDMYVMAPQAPPRPAGEGLPPMNRDFKSIVMSGEHGWNRTYLGLVCDEIRRMIANGEVDPRRVYVTGLSMGGYGTINAMSVGADLFAAAAPICPTMTPDSFEILRGLVHAKIWVSTAYVDHTIYRHKYITDAIMELRDKGNKDARLTIYSPEELAAYGIGIDPDMPLRELFAENHSSWILTYHNEHGILSWLTEQVK